MPWHDTLSIASKTQTHDGRVQRSKWNAESLHSSTRSMSMIDSRSSAEVGLRFEDFIILSRFYLDFINFMALDAFAATIASRYVIISWHDFLYCLIDLFPDTDTLNWFRSVSVPSQKIKRVANESTTLHSNPPRCKFHDSKNVEKTNIHNCSSVHITSIITFSYVYTSSQFLII